MNTNEQPLIISLAGNKGVGKDTAALYIIDHYNFGKVAFADALKDATAAACEMPMSLFYDPATKDFRRDEAYILDDNAVSRFLSFLPEDLVKSLDEDTIDKIYKTASGKEIFTAREGAQFFGTDIARGLIDKDIWINIGKDKIKGWLDRGIGAIVTDARFPNERKLVRDLGGVNVLIQRSGHNGDGHISENSLGVPAEYDYLIYNYSTIDNLNKSMDNLVGAL